MQLRLKWEGFERPLQGRHAALSVSNISWLVVQKLARHTKNFCNDCGVICGPPSEKARSKMPSLVSNEQHPTINRKTAGYNNTADSCSMPKSVRAKISSPSHNLFLVKWRCVQRLRNVSWRCCFCSFIKPVWLIWHYFERLYTALQSASERWDLNIPTRKDLNYFYFDAEQVIWIIKRPKRRYEQSK